MFIEKNLKDLLQLQSLFISLSLTNLLDQLRTITQQSLVTNTIFKALFTGVLEIIDLDMHISFNIPLVPEHY